MPSSTPLTGTPAAAVHAFAPVFLSHGSPMTALEPGAAGAFWSRLGPALVATGGGRPRAILAVSAHSLARQPVLLAAARHPTVHDFGGFPDALYRLRYDAPGAPALAERVQALWREAGLGALDVLDRGGLDHGIWVPLRSVFPDADVPVLPLAFPPDAEPSTLLAWGRALAPLAAEGVWILGTGSLTHNLGLVFGRGGRPPLDAPEMPECRAFRDWVADHAARADWPALADWQARAPHARQMHPSDEHWLPFYAPAGAGVGHAATRLHDGVTYGCLAMDAYAFGPAARSLADALKAASPSGAGDGP